MGTRRFQRNGFVPRVIAAGLVLAETGDLAPGVVEVEDGRIVRVRGGWPRRADAAVPDAILIPGLIDLQINGASGVDFLTCDPTADLAPVRRYLLSTGVTAFAPTLISAPLERLTGSLRRWREAAQHPQVPRIIGAHLEGPYLHPSFAGAHDPRQLRCPDASEFATLLDAAPDLLKIVTLAPELEGAAGLIRAALGRGITAAAGHSAATYEQARGAFDAGVSLVTHLFNAMRPVHHRDPGIAAAALLDPRVTVSLIADLVHLHPAVLRMVVQLKGWRRIVLISDAISVAGARQSSGRLASRRVRVTDAARLADGTLAGSVLALDQAVRNVVGQGVPLREAVFTASAVPARLLGRRDLGRIAPGAAADFVLLDQTLRVRQVFVGGRRVFARPRNEGR